MASDAANTSPLETSAPAHDAAVAKQQIATKILARLREDLASLERLIVSGAEPADVEKLIQRRKDADGTEMVFPGRADQVVEGVFDGQQMVSEDGKRYAVPPNYASKSKLVEGDLMKLTILPKGEFLYKQIGPVERQRLVGTLAKDEFTDHWVVVAGGKKYSVLSAPVSFYKGEIGDDAVVLVPSGTPSKWAAVENIVKRT